MDNYKAFKVKIRATKAFFIEELLYHRDETIWGTGFPTEFANVPEYAMEELEEEGLVLNFYTEKDDKGKIKKLSLKEAIVTDKGKEFYRTYREEQKKNDEAE